MPQLPTCFEWLPLIVCLITMAVQFQRRAERAEWALADVVERHAEHLRACRCGADPSPLLQQPRQPLLLPTTRRSLRLLERAQAIRRAQALAESEEEGP